MLQKAFYFTVKALSVLKIFKFLSWHFGHVWKTSSLKRLISTFTTSQPGSQTIAIHTFPNISWSKGNQTIKFGQLKKNIKWWKFFLKNHTQNVVEKLFPDHFLNSQIWAYLQINSLKFYTVCLYCMPSWGLTLPDTGSGGLPRPYWLSLSSILCPP